VRRAGLDDRGAAADLQVGRGPPLVQAPVQSCDKGVGVWARAAAATQQIATAAAARAQVDLFMPLSAGASVKLASTNERGNFAACIL
jgi:hypothetical protein